MPSNPNPDEALMSTLFINDQLEIPLSELSFSFDRSPGPGGQNVNKVNTRAEVRFNLATSDALNAEQRQRLLQALAGRLTQNDLLIVRSNRHRTQLRNKEDCLEKFAALLAYHLRPPPAKRKPTRPGRGAKARRRTAKTQHSEKKGMRRRPSLD